MKEIGNDDQRIAKREKKLNMTVEEIINELIKIEDKSKEVRLVSADHSNDAICEVYIDDHCIYLLGI